MRSPVVHLVILASLVVGGLAVVPSPAPFGASAPHPAPPGASAPHPAPRPAPPGSSTTCDPGCELWSVDYDAAGDSEQLKALAVDPNGERVFITGWVRIATQFRWGTLAYDAVTGERLWAIHAPLVPGDINVPEAIAISPDGDRAYVTGRVGGGAGFNTADFGVRAYDAETGEELWLATYNGTADANDDPRAIAVSSDGTRVFVAGNSIGPAEVSTSGTSTDYATVAFDAATGEELWSTRYDGAGMADLVVGMAVSPDDDRVYVVGSSPPVPLVNAYDYATLAYDAATGEQLWEARYDGPGTGLDSAADLALTPDGETLLVTGTSDSGARAVAATVAYDTASGAERWVARLDHPWLRASTASAVTIDGSRAVVLGRTAEVTDARVRTEPSAQAGWDSAFTIAGYDLDDGEEAWVTAHRAGEADVTTGVAARDGAVVGTGYTTGLDGTLDPATLTVHTATGQALWLARADDGGDSAWANDVALSPDGTIAYVAGTTGPVSNRDFLLTAYRVGAVPGEPHLLDRRGDAVVSELGADARPVSSDGADLSWGRFETVYRPVSEDEGGGQAPGSLVVRLGTLASPAADGLTLDFEVHAEVDGCAWSLSTSRRGPLAAADDPPEGEVRWIQGEGCPGGAGAVTNPEWTVAVRSLGRELVIEIPFDSLTPGQASLLRVGARLEQPRAVVVRRAGAVVVDETPEGVTAVIGP